MFKGGRMILNEFDFNNQLTRFFNDWKVIEKKKNEVFQKQISFEQKLQHFFQDWRKFVINDRQLAYFFAQYHSDGIQLPILKERQQGLKVNIWKIAGLKSDEVRHSKVLKWLLDWRGDHGQDNAILLHLLQELPILHKYHPQRYLATEECCPLGNKESRVDIEIDADDFLLFIEIKINANEGRDQLQRYIDIAQVKANNRDWCIIYLTRDGKLPERYKIYEEDKKIVGISWKHLSRIFHKYAKESEVNNRSAWLVKQFADHIENF